LQSPVFFEGAVVERSAVARGRISIALFDGSIEHAGPHGAVAVLECREESARALAQALSSVLEGPV
jgi:hypothetical protein